MVKYSGRKKAAKAYARANGVSYTAAARPTNHRRGLLRALAVHTGVMLALEAAGWPAEYETFPEDVQHRGYAGPARLTVGRADQVRNFTGDDPDPETATCWTYLGRPVDMACPLIPTRYEAGIELELTGDRPVGELVAAQARMVADGRGRALAQLADATPCGVCEDLYPVGHLLVVAAGRWSAWDAHAARAVAQRGAH